MESLVLATSLLLSSQSPVIATDIQADVEQSLSQEASRVAKYVQYTTKRAARDTFLYQAKLVIRQAKQEKQALQLTELAAE